MTYGKSFGAVKTAIIRTIRRGGYSPKCAQITVYASDRSRLRKYCKETGGISIIDGVARLLDGAKIKQEQHDYRDGVLKDVIRGLKYKAKEFDAEKLIARIKDGEFDSYIYEATNPNK